MLPGATTTSDLFAEILKSGTITGVIIRKYNLMEVFGSSTRTDAHKMLEGITKIRVSPEGIISVSVTWYDRHLAADIANSYVEELDRFNTETAMTVGKKYRIFIEQRLREATNDLTDAEDALRAFQEEHRTVALDVEVQSLIEAVADLKSKIILLEVQKAALGSPSSFNNPSVRNINKQLRELRDQLKSIEFGDTTKSEKEFGAGFAVPFSKLPEVALEYARLVREIEVQSAIYEILTQQYEQAKIMEVKDTPTVQVLDAASPPEKKSAPKRGRMVVFAALFSIIFGVSFAFFLEWFDNLKKRPSEFNKLLDVYTKIKTDLRSIQIALLKKSKPKKFD